MYGEPRRGLGGERMTNLNTLQSHWETFAQRDPLWAICTDPSKKNGGWDLKEFFATGTREVHVVLEHLRSLGIEPDGGGQALDFGCGVGRLTQALAAHFQRVTGIDISPTMVNLARHYNQFPSICEYQCNASDVLPFGSNTFTFIYASIVLQHIEPQYAQKYLSEFVRVLKANGILVFQMPDHRNGQMLSRIRERVRIRSRLKTVFSDHQPHPQVPRMEMHCISEQTVRELLSNRNAAVVDVRYTNSHTPEFSGRLSYLPSEPGRGFVSKQYCVVKN